MANRIDLSNILINFLKKARYERHIEEGTLEENQFYAVTDGNEKTEYGDLFGNIENQADLYNALYASRLFKMEMCNDPRGYNIVHKLYDRREFDLSKFTVVGNPVISEDGIASGFSSSNYINTGFKLADLYNKKWVIKTRTVYKYLNNNGDFGVTLMSNYGGTQWLTQGNISVGNNSKNIVFYGRTIGGAEGAKITITNTETNIKDGDIIYLDLSFDLEKYTLKAVINNSATITKSWTPTTDDKNLVGTQTSGTIYINSRHGGGILTDSDCQIDLKQFSITVDGKEVFNGLKDLTQYDTYTLPSSEVITIPYIPSVDGVKIVDVAYKPLVDQLYTETGMGNYIIIDETNKTFRLPLPDIYSQIENKTSFTLRKWED